ncbi:MAG: putative Ig domain-containing protein [Deltaproteobacteria bacterium]|jgi:Tol biopolymer transport system component
MKQLPLLAVPIVLLTACSGTEPVAPPVAIVLETETVPDAEIGTPYAASIEASGGTETDYKWSVTSGALPNGLSLRTSGTPATRLSGTPTELGSFTFTVEVEDSVGTKDARPFTIVVGDLPPVLAIRTLDLQNAATRTTYDATIEATGGSNDGYRWRVASGTLPAGLMLEATGTPSTRLYGDLPAGSEGSYTFTIEVRDDDSGSARQSYTIEIVDDTLPLVFVTTSLPTAEQRQPYDATIEVMGGVGGTVFRRGAGQIPPGLALTRVDDTTARLSGTPTESGTFTVQVEAEDAEGQRARKTFFLEISEPPPAVRITTISLPPAMVGAAYEATIAALNGAGDYTWAIVNGRLPAGLTLEPGGRPSTRIVGTPTEFGTFEIQIEVTDARGGSDDQTLILNVAEQVFPITIVGGGQTIVLPNAVGGEAYSAMLTAQDGFGQYNWVVSSGALPNGLTLQVPGSPSTVISGAALQLGTFTATVTVYDWNNATASVPVQITVDPPSTLPTITTMTVPDAPFCSTYRTIIQGTGGSNGGYQWSVVNGALPPGIVLGSGSRSATLGGPTGATASSYNFTIRLTDTFGLTDERTFTIDVADLPGGQRWVAAVGDFVVSASDMIVLGEVCTPGVPTPIPAMPAAPVSGGNVDYATFSVAFSPNGNALAFIGDLTVDAQDDVYVVDLRSGTPSEPIVVSGGLGFSGAQSAVDLRWSPDGTKLAFRADVTTSLAEELFVVDVTNPAAPGQAVRVSSAYVSSATEVYLPDYHFSPDGTKIAFIADEVSSDDMLFFVDLSALPAGGAPGPLTPVFSNPASLTDINGNFQWTPDSRALIFNADFNIASENELFWVDTTGGVLGTPIVVSGPMVALGGVQISTTTDHWQYWSVSPDGTKLFYIADQEVDFAYALYIVDISGSVPGAWQRATIETPVRDLVLTSAKWSPDSQRIAMRGDLDVNLAEELYIVDVSGSLPQPRYKLSATNGLSTLEMGADAKLDYEFSPDGSRIAYIGDLSLDGAEELYLVDLEEGPPYASIRVNTPALTTSNDVTSFQWSPDGNRIAYVGTLDLSSTYELYVVNVSGSAPGPQRKVHPNAVSTTSDASMSTSWAGNWDWFWTADGQRLIFEGAFTTAGADEVWVSDVSGSFPVTTRVGAPNTDVNRDVYRMWSQGAYSRVSYLP